MPRKASRAVPRSRQARYDWEKLTPSILQWISAGRPLASWSRAEPGRPLPEAVFERTRKDPDGFGQAYMTAREVGAEVISQGLIRIADGRDDTDPSDVERRRLRIWTRQWLLARWYPARYGDRKQIQHDVGLKLNVVTGLPDREIAAIAAPGVEQLMEEVKDAEVVVREEPPNGVDSAP